VKVVVTLWNIGALTFIGAISTDIMAATITANSVRAEAGRTLLVRFTSVSKTNRTMPVERATIDSQLIPVKDLIATPSASTPATVMPGRAIGILNTLGRVDRIALCFGENCGVIRVIASAAGARCPVRCVEKLASCVRAAPDAAFRRGTAVGLSLARARDALCRAAEGVVIKAKD
jgi:hypothetical protein